MKFLLSLFFLLFSTVIFSQQRNLQQAIQDFEKLNVKSEITSSDIDRMITLCDELSVYDPNVALDYLEKVKIRMKGIKDLTNITYFCSQISRNYLIMGEYDKGLQAIEELYEEYKKELTQIQEIHFQVASLSILERKGDYEECLLLIDKLMKETASLKNEYVKHYQAVMYSIKGAILVSQKGKYKEATHNYLQALRLYKESPEEGSNVATTYNRLGLLHDDMEEYQKSISYFMEGITFLENNPPKSGTDVFNLFITYSNLGSVYQKTDSLDKALHYHTQALQLAEQAEAPADKSRILHNIGNIYLEMEQYEKALEYIEASQQMCRSMGISEGMIYNYIALGKGYTATRRYATAQKVYDSALVHIKKLVYPKGEVSVYQGYADLYSKMGNFKKALEYHTLYYNLEKELFGIEKQEAIAQLEIEYQTELKDEEIKRIRYEYDIKKTQNQKLIIGFISLVSLTGIVIFFLIYRNRTLKDLYRRNVELMESFKNKDYTELLPLAVIETLENNEEDNLKIVFNKLLFSLENEKIYKDPELTLSRAADIIKSNEKYVSSAIAAYTKTNYNNFINSYRIQEAKILIYENNGLNINEVMYACGFNSRTTFYEAFKKLTGMSPKQFKDMKGQS